jgi:hypothetical protein
LSGSLLRRLPSLLDGILSWSSLLIVPLLIVCYSSDATLTPSIINVTPSS